MKIIDYIYPKRVFDSLTTAIKELGYHSTYKRILLELNAEGKLSDMGMRLEKNKLYVGVNLNPELLMYTDESKDSVELKFVSEKMKRYTDFLQKEEILDAIKADYERVLNDDFYGYVVEISYDFKTYTKRKFIYDIGYSVAIVLSSLGIIYATVPSLL